MTTAELLSHLRSLSVKVWPENGELCCSGPRGALTPDLRAALSERKAEILVFLNNAASVQDAPLRRGPRDGDLPLSFAQHRLWFIDQFEPGTGIYNVSRAFRVKGPLKVDALHQALNEIIRRHEVLRTTFLNSKGIPVQAISPSLTIALPLVNLTDRPESEREEKSLRLANEESRRPFDLARGPLLRAALFRLTPEDHVLLLIMHHIVSDGWSLGVLYRELSRVYDAFSSGRSSPLSELPVQYVDFAQWQRRWLQGEVLEQQLSYWKSQLDGISTLQLPTDHPRPAVQSFRGAKQSLVLSQELSNALKLLSRQERVTIFMTLLAAFKVLLYRYSGQEDIAVSTPIAGRNRVEIEGLIGFFVNTLVLRNDLSGNCSFRELLRRVREVALGAYAHQDLPFDKLIEELQPERNLSHAPFSQVMFAFQNYTNLAPQMSGLTVSPLELKNPTAKFDLTLQITDDSQGFQCLFEYNTDLFDGATVRRMLGHFQTLLEGIAADPAQPIGSLPLLTQAERHQLLVEWNDTKRDYPRDTCVHESFEAQVERSPDAVAVAFEDKQLTYAELNRRANQLARYLRKHGVGPEVVVGLCMERSLELVVALLGILKAGGAYVPLDPSCPRERLDFMLQDTQMPVILTQPRLIESSPKYSANALCLEMNWRIVSQEKETNLTAQGIADNLAYVIYTSGSTGKPKGVMISHRAISNHMFWMQEQFPLTEKDRIIQKTPFSFDASVWEFFAPLLTGARLVMAAPGGHHEPSYLVKLIAEKKISIVQIVPSLLKALVEEKEIENCECLRHVFCGGEALSPELSERFFDRLPVDLWNLYGPTEASIDAAFWPCKRQGNQRTLPIGRPIANTEIYLLDAHLQPVPTGVTGEIHIAGTGLARGYLNRPALTAEKFIPNPFSAEPGARLYKTGDLARYLPDGNIEFLGRIDHQVKIRGFRIELGEIEAVLGQHPGISKAVVIAREDLPGDKRLVGYVVPRQSTAPAIGELRSFLKAKLPEYMIPSAFVVLDFLPLTPSGKIDRRAFPAPGQSRPEVGTLVGPRNPVEESLVKIWREVLSLDQVGIRDNFFELGGHSLLATQVISRLAEAFHVELPLRSLFEDPTVSALAERIETALWMGEKYQPPSGEQSQDREQIKL